MGRGLPTAVDTRLLTFNSLALQAQDEAYTLAYYLLGDDRCAEQATQAAFNQLYQQDRLQADRFRLEVFRRVIASCQQNPGAWARRAMLGITAREPENRDAMFGRLMDLRDGERCVIVLVDVLGLDYVQAAQVLGSSKKQVGKLLAQARLNLSQVEEVMQ